MVLFEMPTISTRLSSLLTNMMFILRDDN